MAIRGVEKHRRNAPFHVQVEILRLRSSRVGVPLAFIDACVARVFRGDLRVGDKLRFNLVVTVEGSCGPGETAVPLASLEAARYLEVFLEGEPPNCRVVPSGIAILSEMATNPSIPDIVS
jgi:hypothetical protein